MFMNQSSSNWGYQEELSSTARPIAIDNQQVSARLVGCPAQLPPHRRTSSQRLLLVSASLPCTQPGPVLAPLRRDFARRTFRIWHRYGSCPALRRRFSAPLPLSPDARSPRASIVLTFHAFFLCSHLGHTGTSAISAQSKLKSEGASIRL